MTYALGTVKPWVRKAADEIGPKFNVTTIYGVGARAGVSDHPLGLALDFMVYSDKGKGDAIAQYAIANLDRLAITYIIWQQRIYHRGVWDAMPDRGSPTANHRDHVHISFTADGAPRNSGNGGPSTGGSASAGGSPDTGSTTQNVGLTDTGGIVTLGKAVLWLTNQDNLIRLGIGLGGAALVIVAIVAITGSDILKKTGLPNAS